MSVEMEEEIKRWTARRKSAVPEIIQGKTSVSEASRQFDIPPSEIESWVDDWIQFYNQRRPHRALGMKTPAPTYALVT